MKLMHRPHFCWANEAHPDRLFAFTARAVNQMTGPSTWLVPKNPQLHKCQRCGYIVWRAA